MISPMKIRTKLATIAYMIMQVVGVHFCEAQLLSEQRLEMDSEFKEPILVYLKNGRTIAGHATNVSEKKLQLSFADGVGEITFTFEKGDILKIEIPGEHFKNLALQLLEEEQPEDALEVMDKLYAQRSNLLPLLEATESHFFIYYIDLILDSQKPARAVAVSKRLAPQITNPQAIRALEDTTLESYNTLQLHNESIPLAKSWIESRTPFYKSALGYYILGAANLRNKDYSSALDTALLPIVFSSPNPQDKLAHCYAVAISAAVGLREKGYAHVLLKEMKERDLLWPEEDPIFEPYLKKLLKPNISSNETI